MLALGTLAVLILLYILFCLTFATKHGRNRLARDMSQIMYKVKQGLDYATKSKEHAATVVVAPLVLLLVLRLLFDFGGEQEAWQKVLSTHWDSLWLWSAIVAFALLGIALLRNHASLDPKFMRFFLWTTIIVGLVLIFLPWLVYFVPTLWPANLSFPSASPSPAAPKNGKVYATLTGREEKGVTILSMPPGSTYQVCYEKGKITSYNFTTRKSTPEEMWGNSEGYVLSNQQGATLDWRQNFRYSSSRGVLPFATLVVVGDVGSDHEKVIPFPTKQICVNATNDSKEVQPLNIYFHALQFFWWQEGDGYAFPTQTSAVDFGRTHPVKYNGWEIRGKDGATETFVATPLP